MQDAVQPIVAEGEIITYRLFDIAYAVDLDRAEKILARRPSARGTRRRLNATPPKAVAYDAPPVVLSLEPVLLSINGSPLEANVTGRLYDFGAVSLAIGLAVRDLQWSAFVDLLNDLTASVSWGAVRASGANWPGASATNSPRPWFALPSRCWRKITSSRWCGPSTGS